MKTFRMGISILMVCIIYTSYTVALANPSDMDPSFNKTTPVGFNSDVRSVAIQDDGSIIAGGDFTTYQGSSANHIIRLNEDGSIDTSFAVKDGFDIQISTIAIQDNGKIIVGGGFTSYQGESVNRIIRLNTNGSIDDTFVVGNGFDSTVNTLFIQDDGKIIVGGYFTSYQGESANRIIRLNTDGSIDHTFIVGDGFSGLFDVINTLALQNDGKIIVGGIFTGYQGTLSNYIIRLNEDGSIDDTFVAGDGFNSSVQAIIIQDDGKIIIGGDFTIYQGEIANKIIRLNTGGSIDDTFVVDGGADAYVFALCLQDDGKVIIGGSFTAYQGESAKSIIRLDSDGSIDDTFVVGNGFDAVIHSIVKQEDGTITVGGNFTNYQGMAVSRIAKLENDGSKDMNFYIGNGFDNPINIVAVQPDGKIIVGGDFTSYQGESAHGIIRFNTNGTRDESFDIGIGFLNRYPTTKIKDIAIQNDGKIIVVGSFISYQGESANRIIRLNTDGSIDHTFTAGDGFVEYITTNCVKVQNDGKILVGGEFNQYQDTGANYIIRLNADGSIDNTFVIENGFDHYVNTIAIQDDGKILVGGSFSNYQGESAKNIIRLNTDGSIDNTFVVGELFNASVKMISMQNDGRILVGGDFYQNDGAGYNHVVRLNEDGSPDDTFLVGDGFDNIVSTATIQNDGKIIVGGYFTSYQGKSANRIIRLNTDASIDTTFSTKSGFNSSPSSIVTQEDGKIIVGGKFNNYKSRSVGYLVSLYGDSEFVIIPDTTDANIVEQEFTNKGYIKTNGDLAGSKPISLEVTDGYIPVKLHLKNDNIKATIQEGSQFIKSEDSTTYDGIITVPITSDIPSLYNEPVLASFKVGSTSESLEVSGGIVTLSVPVPGSDIGDMINVYYSEDNGATRRSHGSFMISNYSGDAHASFTTNHFSDFAITIPGGNSINGSFVINNDDETTTGENVELTLSTSYPVQYMRFSNEDMSRSDREAYASSKSWELTSGFTTKTVYVQFDANGDYISDVQTSDTIEYIDIPPVLPPIFHGGGGITIEKDFCPNGDLSQSFYDNRCEDPLITGKDLLKEEEIHGSAISGSETSNISGNQELYNAYLRAYTNGITTAPTINLANVDGYIKRSELAKMIVKYATNILGKEVNTGRVCDFMDIDYLTGQDLYDMIIQSCQLGLMGLDAYGVPETNFSPRNITTRAEVATVLSRLLFGPIYNLKKGDHVARYSKHLTALKKENIIKKATSVFAKEMRGYVMLMLMRAAK